MGKHPRLAEFTPMVLGCKPTGMQTGLSRVLTYFRRWRYPETSERMKNKLVMSVLLGCTVLALNLTVSAQSNSSSNNTVQNVQRYNASFTLAPTTEAPAGA